MAQQVRQGTGRTYV